MPKRRDSVMEEVDELLGKVEIGGGGLVSQEEVKVELEEIRVLRERLMRSSRAREVLGGFGVDAARRLVLEMETARYSSDRLRAAIEVLNRVYGKPVERVMSVNMDVDAFSDSELSTRVRGLMEELGYESREDGTVVSVVGGGEGEAGGGSVEVVPSESGVSGEVREEPGEG